MMTRSTHSASHPKLYALAAFLAVAGLADSIYLTVTHLTGEDVTCLASSGCSEVLSSAYATIGNIPLGAFGEIEDIVFPALFLCSEQSRYITGQVLNVNGGVYM